MTRPMLNDGRKVERAEKYEVLVLTCDPATVVRLGSLVCQDLGIDAPSENIRSVWIGPPPSPDRPRKSAWWWINAVGCVIASGFSGLAMIVGYVVVFRWIMRRLA